MRQDLDCIQAALELQAAGGLWREALHTLEHALSKGQTLTEACFASAMDACIRGATAQRAMTVRAAGMIVSFSCTITSHVEWPGL